MLQRVAVCCSLLQYVTACHSMLTRQDRIELLQCVAVCCGMIQYVTAHHSALTCNDAIEQSFHRLQHTTTHFNKLQLTQCNTLQRTYCNTRQAVMPHTAPHCNILQHTATDIPQYAATHTLQHTSSSNATAVGIALLWFAKCVVFGSILPCQDTTELLQCVAVCHSVS